MSSGSSANRNDGSSNVRSSNSNSNSSRGRSGGRSNRSNSRGRGRGNSRGSSSSSSSNNNSNSGRGAQRGRGGSGGRGRGGQPRQNNYNNQSRGRGRGRGSSGGREEGHRSNPDQNHHHQSNSNSEHNGGGSRSGGRSGPIVFKKPPKKTVLTKPEEGSAATANGAASTGSSAGAAPKIPEASGATSPTSSDAQVFVASSSAKDDAPVLEAIGIRRTAPKGGFATAAGSTPASGAETSSAAVEAEKPKPKAKAGAASGAGWWTKKAEVRSADSDFKALHKGATHFTTASEQQVAASKLTKEENEARLFNGKSQGKGINFNKYDNIPVEATGRDCPECFDTFEELMEIEALAESKAAKQMLANIKRSGFTNPTPVQKWSLPIALASRDLMACAQTGSGKTGGFLFPLILRTDFLDNRRLRKPSPSSLILAPTRELATQIFNEAEKFTYETGVQVVVVYGGTKVSDQTRTLRRGCDILVATPGRLCHFLESRKVSLHACQHLVLDEADRMLDMGFEPQIREIVEHNGMPGAGDRLTLMFSATFPVMIQRLAADFLDDYIFLTVGRVGSTTDNIKQQIYYVEPRDKLSKACQLLREPHLRGLTLVFVETKRSADDLERALYDDGHHVTSIHGDRTQEEREMALYNFKTGNCQVLVATDVASRGLDIPEVKHVINYDMPSDIDSYVHRIGRTGRAGNTGIASGFFCDKNNNIVRPLLELLTESKQLVPDWLKFRKHEMSHPGERRNGRFGGKDFRQHGGGGGGGGGRGRGRGGGGSSGRNSRGGKQRGPRGQSRGGRGSGGAPGFYQRQQQPTVASTTDAW